MEHSKLIYSVKMISEARGTVLVVVYMSKQYQRWVRVGWAKRRWAMVVYCALKHRGDFKTALITAVNHDGDSDSTGAITGNVHLSR